MSDTFSEFSQATVITSAFVYGFTRALNNNNNSSPLAVCVKGTLYGAGLALGAGFVSIFAPKYCKLFLAAPFIAGTYHNVSVTSK
jgi:hypothetical protein